MCAQLCTNAPRHSHTVTHAFPGEVGPQGLETLRALSSSPPHPQSHCPAALASGGAHVRRDTKHLASASVSSRKEASLHLLRTHTSKGPGIPVPPQAEGRKRERGILSVSPGGKQGPAIESLPTAEVVRCRASHGWLLRILGSVQRPELEGWGTMTERGARVVCRSVYPTYVLVPGTEEYPVHDCS